MKNIAYAILDGNLTADPDTQHVGVDSKTKTTMTIAVNHDNLEDDNGQVSYIDIEAWNELAENCAKYLTKGKKITAMGELRQERWKNPDGLNRSRIKIVANTIRFDK